MPDEPTPDAPEQEPGTAEPEQVTLASAFEKAEAALNSSEEGTGQTDQTQGDTPDTPGTVVEPVPEHIKWAKSIQGDTDAEGNLIVDKIAQRSFNLNKQNQDLVQRLNRLENLLETTVKSLPTQQRQTKDDKPQEEKSDEQILQEYIDERVDQKVRPIIAENQTLHEKHMKDTIDATYAQLKQDFGTDENGNSVYDSIAPEIGQQLQEVAAQNRISVPQLTAHLIRQGTLYSTFSNLAKNAMYPRLQEKLKGLQTKTVESKARTSLPKAGTAAQHVSRKEKVPSSIMEAYEQAEAANPQFKEIT